MWEENWKYKPYLISAMFLAILSGYHMPTIGMLFGMVTMDLLERDPDKLRQKVNLDFAGFMICAGTIIFILTAMFWLFGYVASRVTTSLRKQMYEHMLTMDMQWYDRPKNMPYALNSILSDGAEDINGFVRNSLGTSIQCLSFLVVALCIGFGFSWRMALLVLAAVPFMGFSGFLNAKFHKGFAMQNKEIYFDSMGILAEAVKNYRTVASFNSQERILTMFINALAIPLSALQSKAIISGLCFGLSQMLPFLVYSALFYFCALFAKYYSADPRTSFAAVYALLFGAMAVGQSQQYAPDMGKASSALVSIYEITDEMPSISSTDKKNPEIKGRIEFQNVTFRYPTRDGDVLKDFNMVIEPGQKVAIVGISGSGKSTIVQLIERFYDVNEGKILIDGIDIKEYSLKELRQSIGFVSQEPALFDTTIEANVKYGCQTATEQEVRDACTIAEAIHFIELDQEKGQIAGDTAKQKEVIIMMDGEALDAGKGFQRKVGAKGKSLSGGQKQRLAIARAILKKPKIMLFDEATSALDSQTEKLVQTALNNVSSGRTSVVIAHRMGTITDTDTIFVLEGGKIVEKGYKKELLEKKGNFYKLYGSTMAQSKK